MTSFDIPNISTEEIKHFGVKGMRWGVRRDNRIARLERVGSGHGSRSDKVRVALGEVSTKSVSTHGSVAGAARNKAANMRARDARAAKGTATLMDVIARHGGDRMVDTGRVDASLRMTPKSARIKVQPHHSATTKRVINDHNNLSDQDFFRKYAVSKSRYSKRVDRYGDPYTNGPLAKSLGLKSKSGA